MKKNHSILFAAIFLLIIAALSVYFPNQTQSTNEQTLVKAEPINSATTSQPLEFSNYRHVFEKFSTFNYIWPINDISQIPDLKLRILPADIKDIKDTHQKKQLFIMIMLPIILSEQNKIRERRFILQQALSSRSIMTDANLTNWIKALFKKYRVPKSKSFEQRKKILLKRFDELPATLILAQAAIESGWGTSRFARQGNSLFGQWTYAKNAGITPTARQAGKSHQVKAFSSLGKSVNSYILNINRNKAYSELRDYREKMRLEGKKLDALKLATGLHRYSQRGQHYVESLLAILNSKEFKKIEILINSIGKKYNI